MVINIYILTAIIIMQIKVILKNNIITFKKQLNNKAYENND